MTDATGYMPQGGSVKDERLDFQKYPFMPVEKAIIDEITRRCKRCYGRGWEFRRASDNAPIPCGCVRKGIDEVIRLRRLLDVKDLIPPQQESPTSGEGSLQLNQGTLPLANIKVKATGTVKWPDAEASEAGSSSVQNGSEVRHSGEGADVASEGIPSGEEKP